MYYSSLTDILCLLFIIVSITALGAKTLIEWRTSREDNIRLNAFHEAWRIRDLIEEEGDCAYAKAKEKYIKKGEGDEF